MCAVHCQRLQLAVEVILGEFKQAKSAEQKVLYRPPHCGCWTCAVEQIWCSVGICYIDKCQPFGVTVSDDFKHSATSY